MKNDSSNIIKKSNNKSRKYSLKTIILKDCPWSKALDELLKIKKIKSKIWRIIN